MFVTTAFVCAFKPQPVICAHRAVLDRNRFLAAFVPAALACLSLSLQSLCDFFALVILCWTSWAFLSAGKGALLGTKVAARLSFS